MSPASPLVSTDWLAEHLSEPGLKIIDASWHLPTAGRDPRAEFESEHIPGARFFDIDGIAAPGTDLPHMAAAPDLFAEMAGALGIAETDTIVVYDSVGLLSAARAWWNFRVMGAHKTYVLDGGLPAWKAERRPVAAGRGEIKAAKFVVSPQPDAIVDAGEVQRLLASGGAQIVDVRPAARFNGDAPEPRPGLRGGHMPGALNLPFSELVPEGRLADTGNLKKIIAAAGIDAGKPVVTSCGSGVTAPLLNLALAQLGVEAMRVYDGSWAEWGGREDLPVTTI